MQPDLPNDRSADPKAPAGSLRTRWQRQRANIRFWRDLKVALSWSGVALTVATTSIQAAGLKATGLEEFQAHFKVFCTNTPLVVALAICFPLAYLAAQYLVLMLDKDRLDFRYFLASMATVAAAVFLLSLAVTVSSWVAPKKVSPESLDWPTLHRGVEASWARFVEIYKPVGVWSSFITALFLDWLIWRILLRHREARAIANTAEQPIER